MADFKPSDDAILIAAAQLAASLAQLRSKELSNVDWPEGEFDYSKQERRVVDLLGWAIKQINLQIKDK
ncbi:MAG: hypothetical protein RLZZ415_269 [Pseudomonadota bacterium]